MPIGYGIDFGTTNSVAAAMVAPDRPPTPILDEHGGPHPSVVWYHPEGITVGREAKGNLNAFAEQPGHYFIRSVKRYLGTERRFDIGGDRRSAYEVAAEVFAHVKRAAKRADTPYIIEDAVVTIPVGFDGRARRDLRRAAAKAGIHIRTFVHEPFAAVVGFYQARGFDLTALPDETLLVFDWGGGTLDIAVTRVHDGRLEEIANVGLPGVAGDRFDEHVRKWATARFLDRHQLRPEAFAPSPRTLDRFTDEAEKRKIDLSREDRVTLSVAGVAEITGQRYHLGEDLDRATFEGLIRNDIENAMYAVRGALDEAGIGPDEVDQVLLIGGSSAIPMLQREMQHLFGTRACSVPNSQTIIAEGAAAVAFHGYQPFLAKPVLLALADGSALPIFDGSTLLPLTGKRVTLFCTDNRDGEARLIVGQDRRQREARAASQQPVLTVPVRADLPRAFDHERLYASFAIDEDLVLTVQAHGAACGQVVKMEIPDLVFGLRLR